ncbi:MAG: HNH endonuclease [Saprospiraceae bacterium]|nr:HNH endonuclease [Saprospiraceae bacterium]
MKKSNNWTVEELTIILNLYWKTPYNKISGTSNQDIKAMSAIIGRTPAAIAYKLMNFTSLDEERTQKGNKGKESASKLDAAVWQEYKNNWEKLAIDSSSLLAKLQNKPIEFVVNLEDDFSKLEGREKERLVRTRVNQYDFRQRVLASYNQRCCITGINLPNLLIASHIIPWSQNEQERLNPKNGLCLNALHDKAFDKGLITITPDYRVKLSKTILEKAKEAQYGEMFLRFDNKMIELPDRFLPDKEFLTWHNQNIFQ